jgi:hypothetical protein
MARSKHDLKIFMVRGSWPFPFDMLRYDSCHPYTENDSGILETLSRDTTDAGVVELTLATSDTTAPTHRRWNANGWVVA